MTTCGVCSGPSDAERTSSSLPNFSGEWVCYAYEGDVDAFMTEMGAGILDRLHARLRRYDVDNTVKVLRQQGHNLDIDVKGRRKFTQMMTIGAGQQVCEEEDGVVLVDPSWEKHGKDGYVLCFEISEQDGTKPRTARHWISGNDLVIEYTTRTACCVKWRYRQRIAPGAKKAPSVMLSPPPPPHPEQLKNGRPDFSGTWNSYAQEGDVDGFFEEMGIGKAGRAAMSAVNYGVGMVEKVIVQNGNNLKISDAWPTGPVTQEFCVDTGEQVTIGTQGREIYVYPTWEHDHVLRVATQPLDRSETPNGPMRYYFQGDNLVVMFESVSGRTVKYLHSRKK